MGAGRWDTERERKIKCLCPDKSPRLLQCEGKLLYITPQPSAKQSSQSFQVFRAIY
jgi:hypothetical protein